MDRGGDRTERRPGVEAVRKRLLSAGPGIQRPLDGDVERVALPATDGDALRDALVAEGARIVVEIGLAYGSSALAIGEALLAAGDPRVRHVIVDPFQTATFGNAGWAVLEEAGVAGQATLIEEPSSVALARLVAEGLVADAAFVDGSHRFHEVFVDLYFLRKLVRPGGLIVLDDTQWPSVASALRYYERNLGWTTAQVTGRLVASRLPKVLDEPEFTDFEPF